MRKLLFFSAFFAAIAIAQTNPLNMTTMQVVKDMGLGINLGNTFDATVVCDPTDTGCLNWQAGLTTAGHYETAWGSPTITKAMIDGYTNAGFKTVRVPVSWSNLMTSNYTINPDLLNRVEEVVDWILSNGMYVILNIHHDGGWWKNFPNDSAECMKKYKRIWEQVSNKFKDKSGYLIFESLNEEGGWDDIWYIWRNPDDQTAKKKAYGLLNAINQQFTTLVRNSGGNNANRHLLIAGYQTNIDRTIDSEFRMPTDSKNRQAVSAHYYDPFGFTHLEKDESWATMRKTWGTADDYNQLNTEMDKMKNNYVNKNIPVIIGEYGVAVKDRSDSEIRKYTLAVAEAIYTRNMCPVLWDVQLAQSETQYYYDRRATPPAFVDQQLVAGFKDLVPSPSSSSQPSSSSSSSSLGSSSSNNVAPILYLTSVHSNTLSAMQNAVNLQTMENTVLQVFNLKGDLVRTSNCMPGNNTVQLGDLPKGMYIVKALKLNVAPIRIVVR